MKEVWKDIEGFEGLYMVSNTGRVRSLERKVPHARADVTVREKILKNCASKKGLKYLSVLLSKNGKPFKKDIHRLVAIAFIPNPENKPQVNHIDCDPTNNNVENLEWCTHYENMQHASMSGVLNRVNGKIKVHFTDDEIIDIRNSKEAYKNLSAKYGVSESTIYSIKSRRTWKYVQEENDEV